MKTYRETSDEVFEKIGEYERAKKRRRRAALRVCGGVAAFALVLSLPVAFVLRVFGGAGSRARTEKRIQRRRRRCPSFGLVRRIFRGRLFANPIPCRRKANKIFNV